MDRIVSTPDFANAGDDADGVNSRYRSVMTPSVAAASSSAEHSFSKPNRSSITLIEGFGVAGDAHAGSDVKHRYLVRQDPTQPNLRQVHLIQEELFRALAEQGHIVNPGDLGENITTSGIDLLALPTGTILRIGADAAVEITGLRNPCVQINEFQDGLMQKLRFRDKGHLVRIAGVMSVVLAGGVVAPGDSIEVDIPPEPHLPLEYIADSHSPVRMPGTQ
jgi:MOSC domain-containing protein YiiM